MSEENNGLRFDIYERVHLPENVAAIDELEEIELVPRIQVIDQGEQAVLQGQLVLNGIYRAQGSEDEQVALEHWIPVEISLPMNRVTRLDDITVDIDTFDVVLLSSRALNITGILSLRGIALEPEEEVGSWESEAFTVTHARSEEDDSEQEDESEQEVEFDQENEDEQEDSEFRGEQAFESEYQEERLDQEQEEEEVTEGEQEQYYASYFQEENTAEELSEEAESDRTEEENVIYVTAEEYAALIASGQIEAEEDDDTARQQEAEQYTADAYVTEEVYEEEDETNSWLPTDYEEQPPNRELQEVQNAQEAIEEIEVEAAEPTREVHIALNGNTNQNETLGIRSILNSSLREQAAHEANLLQQETERQREEASKPQVVEEEIEWQHLFLSKRPDQNEFRRIRMYIVQKADTLEQIALRYSINPRELLVRNNLHESAISEGQLLYLP